MSDQNTLRTIEKLGHGLAEVRQRALIHLNTKLEHELVTLKGIIVHKILKNEIFLDLNESPDFARRLMEWFNYPAPSNIKLILKLTLESTDICGETFVSLGGIDFYKALRPDLEPDDQRSVDLILNRLEMLAPFVSVAPSSTAADSGVADFKDLEHMTDRLGNCTSNDVKSAYFLGENRPNKFKKYPDWFKVTVLPWQTLTLNDRQVLLQTNSSLCSRNISVVSEYCRFLAEVIFQDFPAEVFLQRPAIMQSFVGFISTCGEPIHLENSLKSLFVYLNKFEDRLKQTELRDLKHTQSPGYPLGYEVNQGLDCWEHEPVELLRQNETAIPIILIEIAETISSLFKSINLENAVIVNRILVKITKIFASCVDFHLLPVDDELTKYVLGKIRSILEWITNSMLTYGQRTHASKDENDFKFYASLAQLLETILPNIAPISMIKLVAPASLEKALAMASFDNYLPNSKFYSDSLKVQYLTALDPDAGKAFSNLRNISESLRSTQRLCNNGTNQFGKEEIETLLSNGLKSMKYHRCTIIIEKAIEYTSQYQLPDFLIELMTHSIQTIRENTFQHLKHFVDETILEISNSGNNQLSTRIEFLTLRPILETMIKSSIHDQSHSVSLNCGKIIHILITSNILWSEKMSKQIQTVLYDNLAEFELIVSYSDKLATAVLEVIFSTARLDRERLKSCLRLLLNPRRELRSDVMAMSIALFHDIFGKAMNQIVDLFLIHSPIDFNEQRLMDKVFRVDSVERLAKLVKSDSIELQLKYSAYSQLAVITVDGELAKLFFQDVGEVMLKCQLEKFSEFKALTAEEKEATGSLCDILRQICQVDHDLRKRLSEDLPFIITLIKLVEHTALSSPQHRRVTGFLYLLVLSDVLTIAEKDGLISCPYIISSKLQLPFQVETVQEKTPTEDRQYRREDDILEQNEVAQRTLRLAWNNASSVHSSSKLQMTEQDQFYAQQMSLELDLEQIEYTISNAVDHYGFEKGLSKANILLQTYPRDFTMLFTSTSKLVKFLAKFYQTKPNQIKGMIS